MEIPGISFYDFLGKFITGVLLLALVTPPSFNADANAFAWLMYFVAAYLIGIIWDLLMRLVTSKLRRNPKMLSYSYDKYVANNIAPLFKHSDIVEKYDEAYTLVMMHNTLGSIPPQECSQNFLRNIWLILILYIVYLIAWLPCGENIMYFHGSLGFGCEVYKSCLILLIILAIVIPFAWWRIQMSIYKLVWDNANWTLLVMTEHSQK